MQVLSFTASSFLSKLEAGFGRFVEGPAVYVDRLADVLREYGAGPSTLPLKPLARSMYYAEEDAYGWEPYDGERLRVISFGDNWVLLDGEEAVAVEELPPEKHSE